MNTADRLKPDSTQLSWKPVLHGRMYCSPACGAKCTKVAHDRAAMKAGELADYLGKGWKPRVWENMAWFWEVSNGILSVTPEDQYAIGTCYIARMTISVLHDGVNGLPQFKATHRDARRAVARTLARFDAYIATLQRHRADIKIESGWDHYSKQAR